ncbi:MAG: SUMF1/EgtB/PvdO family nonheme iron enzyme [Polyangiaceae bacterium]|nr:SUMF1/EgtB/PvdO family nonheme iron enzyme [Polyangiaceae bacterium]MCL4751769.1 SUMF1/EgtB/PvdO family nonheme iron enzyme [Myxococcales bacterium]
MPEGPEGNRRALAPADVARTLLRDRVATLPAGDAVTLDAGAESGPRPSVHQVLTVDASSAPPAALPKSAGTVRYELLGELGKGGMGRVDEVFDRVLGRPVAQKRLLRVADSDHATMLVSEAQTCAQLEHPSIVPVYDLDAADDGRPFYTMRVVRGRSLREVLEDNNGTNRDRVPLAQLLGIFRQVCLAVDYAHSRGVVHRDLKPDNIAVGEFGEVYVVDWGIAHLIEGSDVRRSGYGPNIAGTPAYMPPEQLLGEELDARTDVFALGVILYEILCGQRPFHDESIRGVMSRRQKQLEKPPSQVEPGSGVTSFFDDLTLACLAPTRTGRPGRARVLANAVDDYLDAERTRVEREREAQAYAEEGNAARARFEALSREARELEERAEALLADAKPWHDAETKQPAWDLATRARELRAEAARERARTSAAFTSALGRVSDHGPARLGLSQLYWHQFLEAEEAGDEQRMAQYLDLARAYDDGELAAQLANQGELEIVSRPAGAELSIARYTRRGPLLVLTDGRELGCAPVNAGLFPAGSYLVTATLGGREVRYPLLIRRAERHLLDLRVPEPGEIPEGMVLVPGGPFLGGTGAKLEQLELPDFAIGRFPVTLREYGEYLNELDAEERKLRVPIIDGIEAWSAETRSWNTELWVSGDARRYLPPGRELDLPVVGIRWNAARAYATWLARRTGRPYRLPTDSEWEKAMRGADGRPFSMGMKLDTAFAKLRESRNGPPHPEPVGAFLRDESPCGVRDLCGGVGDWTETAADGLPPPGLTEADSGNVDYRVVVWRGGSWSTATATSPMRYTQAVRQHGAWIGLRLVLTLAPESSSRMATERS